MTQRKLVRLSDRVLVGRLEKDNVALLTQLIELKAKVEHLEWLVATHNKDNQEVEKKTSKFYTPTELARIFFKNEKKK